MRKLPSVVAAMTPFPHALAPSSTVADARLMMATHSIHHLPVRDHDSLVGLVYTQDLHGRSDDVPVCDLCRFEPTIVDVQDRLDRVVEDMAKTRTEAVLVVKDDHLAGILTTTDVCLALVQCLRAGSHPIDDEAA